jgi:hypothetical protein
VLRDFCGQCLLTNAVSRAFVRFYSRTWPPIADFIRRYAGVRMYVCLQALPDYLLTACQ